MVEPQVPHERRGSPQGADGVPTEADEEWVREERPQKNPGNAALIVPSFPARYARGRPPESWVCVLEDADASTNFRRGGPRDAYTGISQTQVPFRGKCALSVGSCGSQKN